MRSFRIISLALLTFLLSACQLFKTAPESVADNIRLQGTLTHSNQQWLLQPCAAHNSYIVQPSKALDEELSRLLPEAGDRLFADLAGQLDQAQEYFTPSQRYRLQAEGHACDDPDFPRLLLRASGNEPFWSVLQTPKGLLLNQIDESSVALPYIEEQLPDGRYIISSQANYQDLQLWLTPTPCIDSMSGAVYHLTAHLKLNQQSFQGCAAFGALRN